MYTRSVYLRRTKHEAVAFREESCRNTALAAERRPGRKKIMTSRSNIFFKMSHPARCCVYRKIDLIMTLFSQRENASLPPRPYGIVPPPSRDRMKNCQFSFSRMTCLLFSIRLSQSIMIDMDILHLKCVCVTYIVIYYKLSIYTNVRV